MQDVWACVVVCGSKLRGVDTVDRSGGLLSLTCFFTKIPFQKILVSDTVFDFFAVVQAILCKAKIIFDLNKNTIFNFQLIDNLFFILTVGEICTGKQV